MKTYIFLKKNSYNDFVYQSNIFQVKIQYFFVENAIQEEIKKKKKEEHKKKKFNSYVFK